MHGEAFSWHPAQDKASSSDGLQQTSWCSEVTGAARGAGAPGGALGRARGGR